MEQSKLLTDCPGCAKELRIRPGHVGLTVSCKSCNHRFAVTAQALKLGVTAREDPVGAVAGFKAAAESRIKELELTNLNVEQRLTATVELAKSQEANVADLSSRLVAAEDRAAIMEEKLAHETRRATIAEEAAAALRDRLAAETAAETAADYAVDASATERAAALSDQLSWTLGEIKKCRAQLASVIDVLSDGTPTPHKA